MAEQDRTLLTLNGVQYRLALVKQNARPGPEIAATFAELNDHSKVEHQVVLDPALTELDIGPVIFFKQNGKYTVLTGFGKFFTDGIPHTTPVRGRLISSVALKNAKLQLAVEPEVVAAPVYDNNFANRPRFQDERGSSRYAQNGPARYPSAYRGNKSG